MTYTWPAKCYFLPYFSLGIALEVKVKRSLVPSCPRTDNKVPLVSLLGLSARVVNKWTSDIRATREKDRNEQIR